MDYIKQHLELSTSAISSINADTLDIIGKYWTQALQDRKKIVFCGNGGSATQASHLAAELVGRFNIERGALSGLALTTDLAIITSVGNDYGFDHIFRRQVEAVALPGDILVCLSTSGKSVNVVNAAMAAKNMNIKTIAFTGPNANDLALCDVILTVESLFVSHIQEAHLVAGHILCGMVEDMLCG
jgi:D-sedoheptulose 7-phosphate isomerase